MPTQESSAVSAAEAAAFFSDLINLKSLILAVSGGPDSMALMVLAAHWRDAHKAAPKLIAVTIDHGLRKESKAEAAAVARLARNLKIAHRVVRWTGGKPKTGLQQAARAARYRLLAAAARKAGASHILTAHTIDDQAETVLIRMARGSGLTGLAAMQRVTALDRLLSSPSPGGVSDRRRRSGVGSSPVQVTPTRQTAFADLRLAAGGEESGGAIVLVRPLLDLPKTRLIATLKSAGIPYAEDPSNRDPRFTRARLRGLMGELAGEGLDAPRLALLARRLRRADQAIEAAVALAWVELSRESPKSGVLALDSGVYARLPAEIALRLLGRAVTVVGVEGPVELAKLEGLKEGLDAALARKARFRRSLAGAVVTLAPHRITVERAPPRRGNALTKRRADPAKRPRTR